ncbi:hypothetical protein ACK82E_004696 [Salmonella enterica]
MTTITREQAQEIIDAADEVITALAGTNDDVRPDNSTKMTQLYDDLNDHYAPPEVVRELARIALASLDAKPVAYMSRQNAKLREKFGTCDEWDVHHQSVGAGFPLIEIPESDDYEIMPLYAAPPVQETGVYKDMLNIIDLLENNEWAEHCASTVLGSLLESEITRLVGMAQPAPSESTSQPLTDALRDVIAERQRQISVKGWTPEHDDTYIGCELAAAAISYIEPVEAENYWPADWHDDSFRPSGYRRNLVKATALLVAELERLDRISATSVLSEVPDGEARKD